MACLLPACIHTPTTVTGCITCSNERWPSCSNTVEGGEQTYTDNYKYIYSLRGKNKLHAVTVMLMTCIRQEHSSNPDRVTTKFVII